MALSSRSCVPTPSLCHRVLKCGGVPSEWESEPLKHIGPGLLAAPALSVIWLSNSLSLCLAYVALYATTSPAVTWGGFGAN